MSSQPEMLASRGLRAGVRTCRYCLQSEMTNELSCQFCRLFPQPFRRLVVLRFYRRGFRPALIEVLARRSRDLFRGCEKYNGAGAVFRGDGEFLSNPEEEG